MTLSEEDVKTRYITPAITQAGWDIHTQMRQEVQLTKGRILVRGKIVARGESKFADYVLYYKPNIPIAIVEAKDDAHTLGGGMPQALEYAELADVPFAFSSNGSGFLFHDRTAGSGRMEIEVKAFPRPKELWDSYVNYKNLDESILPVVTQPYYADA